VETNNSKNLNIGSHFLIGLPGPEADPFTVDLLEEIRPGGLILFARNIKSCAQVRQLLDDAAGILGYRPILAVDQEGGLVDRLRRVLSPLPAASKMRSSEDAFRLGRLAGESLAILGFSLDLAPVVDVLSGARSDSSNGLYSRAFGKSREDVVEFAGAFLNGLADFGIVGCLKHFPGLAAAKVDSHNELPEVDVNRNELNDIDLFPYRQLLVSHRPAVMIGHAVYPNADLQRPGSNGKLLPSSLDGSVINGLLRAELEFEGLVISDDMEMGAIVNEFGVGEACVMAMNAGSDLLAICAKPESIREGFRAVETATANGMIGEQVKARSARRIEEFSARMNSPRMFDSRRLDEIKAEIEEFSRSLE
jgi:beta-N-acetylhexosaminidase